MPPLIYRIYPLGDQALTVDWGNRIDPHLNHRVQALYRYLLHRPLPGTCDVIPAYSSLTIVFDPESVWEYAPGRLPSETLQQLLEPVLSTLENTPGGPARSLRVPVCYDPSLAPDLERIAAWSQLLPKAVIGLHTSREYRVYMLGFLPGFAYLGRVDERIATPRLDVPRRQVPAGSVGIAGIQTGIYPFESPGGWNLIGRTPLRIFDPAAPVPAHFQPGDRVRFYAISLQDFYSRYTEP